MEDIFLPIKFKTSVQLTPAELIPDFEKIILIKLQRSLEGTCSRYGYIKRGSIEIIRRSFGQFMKQHFNGYTNFDVLCKGLACNPVQAGPADKRGTIVRAKVINKNALGIHAESQLKDGTPVLDIIVPKRSAGIESERDLEEIAIDEEIFIEVLGKRFQMNDTKISIIGRVLEDDSSREFISYANRGTTAPAAEDISRLPTEPESDLEEEYSEEEFTEDENGDGQPTKEGEESESESESEELDSEASEASEAESEYDNPELEEF